MLKELKDEKYVYVPNLPNKTMISKTSDAALEKRKTELQDFLQTLLQKKELRNSRQVIKFLELNTFCPEFLV